MARVAVEDIVGQYVQLRKGGSNLLGLCPFHSEKTPSFTVSPTKQFYHCFGCGAHGSAITFLMEHTGVSFPQAVRTLAEQHGMQVPEKPVSPRQREKRARQKQERSVHHQYLQIAYQHYKNLLKDSVEAINYLKKRGISGEIALKFGLGWSGNNSRGLAAVLPDYDSNAAIESGLVVQSDDASRYDRFRQRVMFPIHNQKGEIIGFGGRIIGNGQPKYLNSPETNLFSKGHELYGLWQSRTGIRKHDYVLVVEGYMDVVALAQHGLDNSVATLGTATTTYHIQKLMRVSNRIVFCFDGDAAGIKAAWRALETCLPSLRDDVAIRFLFLPDGHDPDSYVSEHGLKSFNTLVEQSNALSEFLINKLCEEHNINEAEGRAACAHQAIPLLQLIPTSNIKTQIVRELAHNIRNTPEELQNLIEQNVQTHNQQNFVTEPKDLSQSKPVSLTPKTKKINVVTKPQSRRSVTPLAKRLLSLLMAHPNLVKKMGEQQLEILEHNPHLLYVRDLITLINANDANHVAAILQALDPETELAGVVQPLATDLLSNQDLPDPHAEWNDALMRIELESIKAEQSALIQAGLTEKADQKRYQELNRQLILLINVVSAEKQ